MRAILHALQLDSQAIAKTGGLAISTAVLNAVLLYMVGTVNRMDHVDLATGAALFTGTVIVFAVAQRMLAAVLASQSESAQSAVRLDLLAHLQRIRFAEFERLNSSEIRALVTQDALIVAQFWPTLVSLFVSTATVLLCICYLAWVSLWQLLALTVGMFATFALYRAETAEMPALLKRSRDSYTELSDMVTDMLDGAKELKLDRRRRLLDFWPRLQALSRRYRDESVAARRKGMMAGATGTATFFLLIGAAIMLSRSSMGGEAQASAQLVIVLLYLSGPINRIVTNLPSYGIAAAAARRIAAARAFLRDAGETDDSMSCDEAPARAPAGNTRCAPARATLLQDWAELAFDSVEYDFAASAERPGATFGPVSFAIRRGEITFVVGANGAGKSTVGKLLTGLYPPTRGHIRLDGCCTSMVGLDDYRQMFSAIYSDFHLFGSSLPNAALSQQQMQLIREFRLPEVLLEDRSYQTLRGLSDGQRRRFALLLALVEDRPIYFFDEWAADQDPEFRAYFYHHVLHRLRRAGKTIIAITHDDMYFDVADQVIRIEGRMEARSAMASAH
ncbi:TPA: cyclic peptide export ABC transporter [Burkholderia multivorans]|uniref:cyclic peptide export ABC transporter n=1 Tax=Burkholderia multivorans TaxID=87883 RepID=UPI0004F6D53D|nr:cyclic peptide export ABC transporter [Burkholderia multivorans]AIO75500.1 cyclic peptide transporter family protein [Burkholderia multivorans]MBU9354219.1 cyclic peptide export ABC transporter [Burkholderia multivorans]MBU9391157.1 cyclic peptide export ABC transporter [Burkholderia multivorans]MBU9397423.1 cyclic peptide export ABC transporter [Burkholderia multivorans]MBU9615888.1 cyclic peptide export ABC transporter [Burkholderia multivorans]